MASLSSDERGWPYCERLQGDCLLHEAEVGLGEHLYEAFMAFVNANDEGGRLMLEKDENGFYLAITGAVDRTSAAKPDFEQLRAIRRQLDAAGGPG